MNENVIILLAKDGNESAFRSLYERYRESIFGLAYHYTNSREDAEDILQETFVKAFRHLDSFRNETEGAFKAWISRICVNTAINLLRKRKRKGSIPYISLSVLKKDPMDQHPTPDRRMEVKNSHEFIKKALDRLTVKQRVIFDMRYTQHHDIKTIAQMLNTSESTVKTQLFRSMEKLRRWLKPMWEVL